MAINQLLLLLAFLCFALAALGVPASRVNLVAAGLACLVLTQVLR